MPLLKEYNVIFLGSEETAEISTVSPGNSSTAYCVKATHNRGVRGSCLGSVPERCEDPGRGSRDMGLAKRDKM